MTVRAGLLERAKKLFSCYTSLHSRWRRCRRGEALKIGRARALDAATSCRAKVLYSLRAAAASSIRHGEGSCAPAVIDSEHMRFAPHCWMPFRREIPLLLRHDANRPAGGSQIHRPTLRQWYSAARSANVSAAIIVLVIGPIR